MRERRGLDSLSTSSSLSYRIGTGSRSLDASVGYTSIVQDAFHLSASVFFSHQTPNLIPKLGLYIQLA